MLSQRDEEVFKLLIQQSKSLSERYNFLEENGITISELGIAEEQINDCIFDYFGIPKDNTLETIIRDDEGNTTILPNCFCRDSGGEILWNYTSGEIDIEKCFEQWKTYCVEVAVEYPIVFKE